MDAPAPHPVIYTSRNEDTAMATTGTIMAVAVDPVTVPVLARGIFGKWCYIVSVRGHWNIQ